MKRDWFKFLTYFAIAAGTSIASAQTVDWRSIVIAAVAGFVAMKALDSNPNKPPKDITG
jgi:hypothetical protein